MGQAGLAGGREIGRNWVDGRDLKGEDWWEHKVPHGVEVEYVNHVCEDVGAEEFSHAWCTL